MAEQNCVFSYWGADVFIVQCRRLREKLQLAVMSLLSPIRGLNAISAIAC